MASTPAIATRIEPEYWTPAEFAKFAKLTTDQVSKLRINGHGLSILTGTERIRRRRERNARPPW